MVRDSMPAGVGERDGGAQHPLPAQRQRPVPGSVGGIGVLLSDRLDQLTL